MYVIKMDGSTLYSPAMADKAHKVLSAKLALDVDSAGSFSLILPPGNCMYQAIRRMKSIITVEQDGEEIFRGRVIDSEIDTYMQKTVYCEGVRTFLRDSEAAPYEYSGTAHGLLRKLISEHNAQVEADKHFTIGNITAVGSDVKLDVKNVAYWKTEQEITEKLLGAYGGYLKTRYQDGVLYIDWLAEYGRTNAQPIRFGVNLLELRDKTTAAEVFTILRPLGASSIGDDGEFGDALTIESVNDGKDYIEDAAGIALHGRIWRTKTWGHIEDPAELKKKGLEYMQTGVELQTLTLKAIDMHDVNGSIEAIRLGDKVQILVKPHDIDMEKPCCKLEIDLLNAENTLYTFGAPPKTLTDNIVQTEEDIGGLTGGGGGRSIKDEAKEIVRWAKINVDEANANILLNAGEINILEGRMSTAEIEIDGLNAQILLKANQEVVTELGRRVTSAEVAIDGANAAILLKADASDVDALGQRMTNAEVAIDGANAQILLKADATVVDDMGRRVTAAEIEIDGLNSEITLKANKVVIDAELTKINKYFSGEATVGKMVATTVDVVHELKFYGSKCAWKSMEVVTGVSVTGYKSGANVMLGDGSPYYLEFVSSVGKSVDKEMIYYMGWE